MKKKWQTFDIRPQCTSTRLLLESKVGTDEPLCIGKQQNLGLDRFLELALERSHGERTLPRSLDYASSLGPRLAR